jgi:streptomycin 6-kinase
VQMEDQARANAAYEQRGRDEPTRGEVGPRRLSAARVTMMRLCATAERMVVLHGDFLDKNLLRNGARYRRADAIAEQMDLDGHRTRRWAAVWTVLQACHAWRDGQSDLETCLASSEFEPLLLRGLD